MSLDLMDGSEPPLPPTIEQARIERLESRIDELLTANNTYLDRARAAEAKLKAVTAAAFPLLNWLELVTDIEDKVAVEYSIDGAFRGARSLGLFRKLASSIYEEQPRGSEKATAPGITRVVELGNALINLTRKAIAEAEAYKLEVAAAHANAGHLATQAQLAQAERDLMRAQQRLSTERTYKLGFLAGMKWARDIAEAFASFEQNSIFGRFKRVGKRIRDSIAKDITAHEAIYG